MQTWGIFFNYKLSKFFKYIEGNFKCLVQNFRKPLYKVALLFLSTLVLIVKFFLFFLFIFVSLKKPKNINNKNQKTTRYEQFKIIVRKD